MKKLNIVFTVLFLPVLFFTEINFLGGRTFFAKDTGNPYILEGTDSFKTVSGSAGIDNASFELKVQDNDSNSFANSLNQYAIAPNYSEDYYTLLYSYGGDEHKQSNSSEVYIDWGQSDVENNIYRFHMESMFNYENNPIITILVLIDFNLTALSPSNPLSENILITDDSMTIPSYDQIVVEPGANSITLESDKTVYPIINIYDSENPSFQITDVDQETNYSVTFQIEVSDWTPTDTLEVSLTDLNETDPLYDTKPYDANQITDSDSTDDIYTYQISNLPISTYEFSSLNNTQFTTSDSSSYIPENNILLADTLQIPDSELEFSLETNNPYVEMNGLTIDQSSSEMHSIVFSMTIIDNTNGDFYTNLVTNNNEINITLIDKDNGDATLSTYATWTDTEKPTDGVYNFKIDNLDPGENYEIYSIDNSGLAVGSSISDFDDEILVNEELGVTNNTFRTAENPYIVVGSFALGETTKTSVTFSIEISNINENFIPSDIDVKMNDENGPIKTGKYISNQDDIYTYKISNLKAGKDYSIYSLNNTGLSIGPSTDQPDDEILVMDELQATNNQFTTSETPYIIADTFQIIEATKSTVDFSIQVNNSDGTFDFTSSIDVTMNDKDGEHKEALSISDDDSTDDIYTYEISGLSPGTDYSIYSLNNSGLAASSGKRKSDDKIILESDLDITDGENQFTTLENPYIVDQGFQIIETTKTSVEFEITISNDLDNTFIPENSISTTITDEDSNEYQTTAAYVGADSEKQNTYMYEITELESGIDFAPGVNYSIYSLNNTGLATVSGSGLIDDEILIVDDLNSNGDFTTTGNAYIEYGGFEITNVGKTTMEFQIIVHNEDQSFDVNNSFSVRMNSSTGKTYEATNVNKDGDTYTYEVSGLDLYVSYTVYSLVGIDLAVGSGDANVKSEITIEDDLGVSSNEFTTLGNSYIERQGLTIIDEDLTQTSMRFSIEVNNQDNLFVPTNPFTVTLNSNIGPTLDAIWISSSDNIYTYKISGLDAGTHYSIYSLNDTGLAVGSGGGDIDDQILVTDELGEGYIDSSFTTLGNPYIEDSGFILNTESVSKNSISFTILVHNWDTVDEYYRNNLEVKLINNEDQKSELHNAKFVDKEGDYYTYEINDLSENTSYTIYSFVNPAFSISPSSDVGEEILLDDIGVTDDNYLTFSTINVFDIAYIIIIVTILILLSFIIFFLYYLFRRERVRQQHEVLNENELEI